jgi:hypothetical protein
VVYGRIMHEAAKSLNAANPNIQLFRIQVSQSIRESVGDLPPVRQAIIACGVEQSGDDHYRAAY